MKLVPLTPRSLPLLPSPCYHSHLAGPHSHCQQTAWYVLGSPPPLGARGQGARWEQAEAGSPHSQITPLTPKSLLSLPPHWTSLPMSNEQIAMYWGPHHLWGQGSRWEQVEAGSPHSQITPLAPTLLQLTPSLLHFAPTSQLTLACSQLIPACSSSLPPPSLLQLTPAHSQLTPAHSQLAPTSQLTSAHSQLAPSSQLTPS